MVGLKGMKDGRVILRIRAAIPWFFQGEGRWEAERRGSPPLPLFFLPFNPPLVWLNSARGTGKRFFYLISLPLLGEGTDAICLLLLSLSLLLTFFFFSSCVFRVAFRAGLTKKGIGRTWNGEWLSSWFCGSILGGRIDLSSSSSLCFFLLLIFLYVFRAAFWERKLREWFSSWFLLRFWVEESMWFVFFLSFFYLVFDVSFSIGLRKGIKRIWNGKRFFYPISFASGWKNRCDFFSSGFSVFSSYLFFFMFFVFFFAFLFFFFRILNRFEEREKRFFFLIPFDFVFRSLPFSLFWADLSKEI